VTALTHFNAFLKKLNATDPDTYPHTDFEEIPKEDFKEFRDIFGQFPMYLLSETKVKKGGTNLNYVTQMKDLIVKKNRDSDINMDDWYKTLRANVQGEYKVQCALSGEKYSESAPPMTRADNLYLAKLLFKENTTEALLDRDLINKLRHSLGRVTEISGVKCSDYSIYKGGNCNTLSVHITRLKTGVDQDITLFMDKDSYLICPVHSLATVCAISSCDAEIFPHIAAKCEAQHVNRMLTRLSAIAKLDTSQEAAELTPGLVSHSPRHGGATEANESIFVQPSWMVARGGWTLGRIEQLFSYIAGTRKTDARVARILAGWEDPDYGGYGLTIDSIPVEDRALFAWYATELLGIAQFSATSRVAVRTLLCCSLLLHYKQMKEEFPGSKLIERMHRTSRVTPQVLSKWADSVNEYWHRQNARFLPLASYQPGDVSMLSYPGYIKLHQHLLIFYRWCHLRVYKGLSQPQVICCVRQTQIRAY